MTDNAYELEHETGVELKPGERLPGPMREAFLQGVNGYDISQPAVRSSSTRLSEESDGVAGWYVPGPVGPHVVMVQTQVDTMRTRLSEVGLTPRQSEVALQLAEGGTNRAIAKRLGIATLRKHLENIYRALGVGDRASAIARVRGW